jgi:hypothetical protein
MGKPKISPKKTKTAEAMLYGSPNLSSVAITA